MFTRRIVTPVAQLSSSVGFTVRDLRRRVALLLLLAAAAPAWAATLIVTTNADSGAGSLRDQIAAAASGDTIVFAAALDGATISLTTFVNDLTAGSTQFGPSAFFISGGKALTIDALANGLTQGVVIARSSVAGTPKFRLFDVGSGSSLTLRGVTLANGYAEGGHSVYAGAALGAGGAIFNQGALTLDRCTLTGNTALGGRGSSNAGSTGGGGVGQNSSHSGGGPNGGAGGATSFGGVDGGTGGDGGFGGGGGEGGQVLGATGNAGHAGSGGFGGGGGQGGRATGSGTQGNGGNGGFGGGAGAIAATPATNGVPGFGGGSANALGSYGGAGAGMGGAIFNDAGTVSLTNVTLTANTANGGGNGFAPAGRGSGYGGAIFNYAGSLTLNFVTVSGNSVAPGISG